MQAKPIILSIVIVFACGLFLYKMPDLGLVNTEFQKNQQEKRRRKVEYLTQYFKDGDYVSVRDLSDASRALWNKKIRTRGKLRESQSRKSAIRVLTDLGCVEGYNSEFRLMFKDSIEGRPLSGPLEVEGTVDPQGFVRVDSIKPILGFALDDCKDMDIKSNVQ